MELFVLSGKIWSCYNLKQKAKRNITRMTQRFADERMFQWGVMLSIGNFFQDVIEKLIQLLKSSQIS